MLIIAIQEMCNIVPRHRRDAGDDPDEIITTTVAPDTTVVEICGTFCNIY